MIVYRCEDSPENLFTAVYRAYEERRNHSETRIALNDDPILFAEDIPVVTDEEKYRKVLRTLNAKFGEEDTYSLFEALASENPEKGQAVYGTIVSGLARKCPRGHLFDHLTDQNVLLAFELARNVGREISHLRGFLRFLETDRGILYAKIGPKNNIVPFLMSHFADRLPMEHFVIHDEKRGLFGIHPAGEKWYLYRAEEGVEPVLCPAEPEDSYQELFTWFCHKIAIKERENKKLQTNMLPLRFQHYMTEFNHGTGHESR